MERRLGHPEDICELVWASSLCYGGGGIQGQMERDATRDHTECVQSAGKQFLDGTWISPVVNLGSKLTASMQLHEHHPQKDFAKYDFFQILSIV